MTEKLSESVAGNIVPNVGGLKFNFPGKSRIPVRDEEVCK